MKNLKSPDAVTIGDLLKNTLELLHYLSRKKLLIIAIALLGAIAGFLTAQFDKPKYQSHLTFVLEEGESGLGGAASLAAQFGFNIGSYNNLFQGDNIVSLLTSRRIIERVLLSVDTIKGSPVTIVDFYTALKKDAVFGAATNNPVANSATLKIFFPPGMPRTKFSYQQDSVLMNIYMEIVNEGQLQVGKPDKKLNVYEVSLTSPNERFTKVFTDRVVKEASEFYTELKSKKSKQTLEILEQRVAQTKGNLNSAIIGRADLQDADLNPAFQKAQAAVQKKQVDITAYGGAYGELYKNLELARYQYLKDIPLLQIIDGAEYPMKKIKKSRLITSVIYGVFASFLCVTLLIIIYFFNATIRKYRFANSINGDNR